MAQFLDVFYTQQYYSTENSKPSTQIAPIIFLLNQVVGCLTT